MTLQRLAECWVDIANSTLLPGDQRKEGTPGKENGQAQPSIYDSKQTSPVHQYNHDKASREPGARRRLQHAIHPLDSSSKSLPLPANENEFIVAYLFRWLCLLRREDTNLSSFETGAQVKTVVRFSANSSNLTGFEGHLGTNFAWLNAGLGVKCTHHWSSPAPPTQARTGTCLETRSGRGRTPPCTELRHTHTHTDNPNECRA